MSRQPFSDSSSKAPAPAGALFIGRSLGTQALGTPGFGYPDGPRRAFGLCITAVARSPIPKKTLAGDRRGTHGGLATAGYPAHGMAGPIRPAMLTTTAAMTSPKAIRSVVRSRSLATKIVKAEKTISVRAS